MIGSARILLLVWVVALPLAAEADPAADFRKAQVAYQAGKHASVIKLLRPLLYPRNRLSSQAQLLEAHKMLGISYVFTKQPAKAEQSFLAILNEQPSYRLDPVVDPASAVRLFDDLKKRNAERLKEIEARLKREADAKAKADREAKAAKLKAAAAALAKSRQTVVENQLWIAFMPFGAGQFQNRQPIKGGILAGLQAAVGAAAIATMVTILVSYPDLDPPAAERNRFQVLNRTMVGTTASFLGLVAVGIVDALWNYQDRFVIKSKNGVKAGVAPLLSPQALGIGFNATF